VCPSSNIALGLYPSYEDHPLGALQAAGVRVTLGSDDPPYFDCSIGSQYALAHERMGLEEGELEDITRIAVEASFADDALKRALMDQLSDVGERRTH
jgi:adenosine deaminase